MLTLICTLPLYATLNIGISSSLAPLCDTVENIDFKIYASLGFCAMTNAFVVHICYLFALIGYINGRTGGKLKILGSIVDHKLSKNKDDELPSIYRIRDNFIFSVHLAHLSLRFVL